MVNFNFSKPQTTNLALVVFTVISLIFSGCSESTGEKSSAPNNRQDLGITPEQFSITYTETLEALAKSSGVNFNHLLMDSFDRSGSDGIGFIIKPAPKYLEFYALYSPNNKKHLQMVKIELPKTMSETDRAALILSASQAATRNSTDEAITRLPSNLVAQSKTSTMKCDGYIFHWKIPSANERVFVYEIVAENSEYANRPGSAERYRSTMIENVTPSESPTQPTTNSSQSTNNSSVSTKSSSLPVTSTQPSNNSSTLSLGGVKLNDSINEMHKIFGREDRITPASTPNHQNYEYRDIVITESGGHIVGLVSYTNAVQTEKGIHQGSTFQQVKDAYGLRCHVENYDDLILYEYPYDIDGNQLAVMRFAIKNNTVDYISLRIVTGNEINDILSTVKTI